MRFHNPAEVHLAKKKVEEGKKKLRIKTNKSHDKFMKPAFTQKNSTCGECHLMANVFAREKIKL